MIALQPVLEVRSPTGFALWPVSGAVRPYGFMPLGGALSDAEVGTAVMSVAECNDIEPGADGRPQAPAEPLGPFLHGMLTLDDLFVPGGLRVTDTVTGLTLLPGCCSGLEERGDWLDVLDGDGRSSFGHDPSPLAERLDDGRIRLTVDAERDDSPVIELSTAALRHLLAGAERDLTDFLRLAAAWAARHVPEHAASVTAALARALVLPVPVVQGDPAVRPGPSAARAAD
ncbi:hypothetical protein [Streptomyces sp. enrichment culture]|uniref:hypothetical protein n=1 Tax=Streptomyces sp. enrichment culture TaxID=1795815 RepID=UPI003F566B3A